MTNYKAALNHFLWSCGDPEGTERDRAVAAFGKTHVAAAARFYDAWHEFTVTFLDSIPFLRMFR